MWALTLWQFGLWPLQWGVVIGASLAAALTDIRDRRIPNALTGPVFLGGLMAGFAIGGLAGLADAAAASLLLALPYLLLFLFANGGGGDAKLMAAVGAWLGLVNGLVVLLAVSLSGIVLALVWVWRCRAEPVASKPSGEDATISGLAVPYGIAILAGVCIAAAGLLTWRLS